MRLRDHLAEVFDDSLFTDAFPDRGAPAQSPALLALVTVLQFTENLTDRQAADASRDRLSWKYALGTELDDAGFDFSALSRFRARLVGHGLERTLFTGSSSTAARPGWSRPVASSAPTPPT